MLLLPPPPPPWDLLPQRERRRDAKPGSQEGDAGDVPLSRGFLVRFTSIDLLFGASSEWFCTTPLRSCGAVDDANERRRLEHEDAEHFPGRREPCTGEMSVLHSFSLSRWERSVHTLHREANLDFCILELQLTDMSCYCNQLLLPTSFSSPSVYQSCVDDSPLADVR